MKQILRLLLLAAFIMSAGMVSTVSYADEEQSTENPECEGEDCPTEEEEEPECD